VIAGCAFVTGCADGGSLDVNDLRSSDAAYYYVGESFDGLKISHVERYQRSEATLIYGDCEARSDQGCAPPARAPAPTLPRRRHSGDLRE
jgi:hypothetical protein